MISKLKHWIGRVAQQHIQNDHPVPHVVSGNLPMVQVFKISNGYLLHKASSLRYREEEPNVIYCATPMDVARQIVNDEALQKMGIDNRPQELQTTGRATGSFNKI